LGLTNFVYPGATHTRFQHAIGAYYLMNSAINIIKLKGHNVSDEEAEAVSAAILLHDIGHGPFSHALEYSLVEKITHEDLSGLFIEEIKLRVKKKLKIGENVIHYYVFTDSISNKAYIPGDTKIKILYNNGQLADIADASDMLNVEVLAKTVTKYFLCYPKNL